MDYLNTYKRLLALADAGLFTGKMLLIKNVTKNYENLRYNLLAQPDTKRLSCRLRKNLN